MVAYDAAGRGAELAVSRHMARDAADHGSLDASFGIRRGRECQGNRGCASRYHDPFHDRLTPIAKARGTNAIRTTSVPDGTNARRGYQVEMRLTVCRRLKRRSTWTPAVVRSW